MEYLTVEDVLIIHMIVIEETGGCPDILDTGLVESAVEQARQTFGGEPLYQTIEEVAASYWHSIATNHGFSDGNKRTAVIATDSFLARNGHSLDMDDDKIIEVGLAMADQGMNRKDVFEIVRQHVVEIDPDST